MIRYALLCHDCEHKFEAWFASSEAYDEQIERHLVSCPCCDGTQVGKQVMAPAIGGTNSASEPDPQKVFGKLAAAARQHVSENFDYVGDGFASEAKAMHYGDLDHRPIWGETTADERAELKEEGVPAEPLPPAFVPNKRKDDESLN